MTSLTPGSDSWELAAIYEISSFEFSHIVEQIAQEALELASRLFGVRRFALVKGVGSQGQILASWGFRQAEELVNKLNEHQANQFEVSYGELGLLFMEKTHPIGNEERRLYTIFAWQVRKALLNAYHTAQKYRALEALRVSQRRYRDFFVRDITANYLSTPQGKLLDCNPAFVAMLGYASVMEVILQNAETFYSNPLDRQRFLELLTRKKTLVNHEAKLKRKDGRVIFCWENVVGIFDENGNLVRFQGYMIDITERKRAEEALRESEDRYRGLVELSPDGIAIHSEGRILFVNSAAAQIMGAKRPEELQGKSITEFVHPDSLEIVKQRIERMLSTGEPVPPIEEKFIRLDGSTVDVEVAAVSFQQQGKQAVQVVVRDITERKRAEKERKNLEVQLIQAQKMETLGTFASGIAHDFNNILSIIMGHASLLLAIQSQPDKLSMSADAIKKASSRGASLVKRLLAFAWKNEVNFEPVYINDIITETEKLLLQTIPKTINSASFLKKDLPPIWGDASQIHQILLNLCANARDAMPQGGKLSISTDLVSGESLASIFPNASAKNYVQIKVSDTGSGMDEETRQRIFEPFFTTKKPGKGTGLGLSVIYGVVQNHNGFIDVESQVGRGTTFNVYLPVNERPIRQKPARKRKKEIPCGTETILVIEDEEMLLEYVKTVLVSKGYTVLTANDGISGIDTYQRHQKDVALILCDLGLPGLSGSQVLKKIREINPEVNVIVASGFIDAQTKSELYKSGLKFFIQKPYLSEEFLEKVREVIDTDR